MSDNNIKNDLTNIAYYNQLQLCYSGLIKANHLLHKSVGSLKHSKKILLYKESEFIDDVLLHINNYQFHMIHYLYLKNLSDYKHSYDNLRIAYNVAPNLMKLERIVSGISKNSLNDNDMAFMLLSLTNTDLMILKRNNVKEYV